VILAALLDGMDGWVARKLGVAGNAGAWADTIADIFSFGIAPSFFIAHVGGQRSYLIVAVFYFVAIILRLVRYHLKPMPRGVYLGLPSPSTALTMVAITVLETRGILPAGTSIYGGLILGLLAVSPIKFPSWYNPVLRFLPLPGMYIFLGIALVAALFWTMEVLLVMLIFYIILAPFLLHYKVRSNDNTR